MEDGHKGMLERLGEAEGKYYESFNELIGNWNKLEERIRPLIIEEEDKTLMIKISMTLLTLPLAHLGIGAIHLSNLEMMRLQLSSCMPPLKITCPDCNKVVWDATEIAKMFGEER